MINKIISLCLIIYFIRDLSLILQPNIIYSYQIIIRIIIDIIITIKLIVEITKNINIKKKKDKKQKPKNYYDACWDEINK